MAAGALANSAVDFHTHVLPCIDDGSPSVEVSLAMLRSLSEQNVNTVAATPHFYANHQSPQEFLKRRDEAARALSEAAGEYEIKEGIALPRVIKGAEVRYFDGISDCEFLYDLSIEKIGCIMVEMPESKWQSRMLTELEEIYEKHSLIPIIAHVDRYFKILSEKFVAESLRDLPVILQANADYFTKKFAAGKAIRSLKKSNISLLGTDCHDMTTRMPGMLGALNVINSKAPQELVRINTVEKRLLSGEFGF